MNTSISCNYISPFQYNPRSLRCCSRGSYSMPLYPSSLLPCLTLNHHHVRSNDGAACESCLYAREDRQVEVLFTGIGMHLCWSERISPLTLASALWWAIRCACHSHWGCIWFRSWKIEGATARFWATTPRCSPMRCTVPLSEQHLVLDESFQS